MKPSPLLPPTQPRPAAPVELVELVMAYTDLLVAAWRAAEDQVPARAFPVALASLRAKGVGDDLLLWMLFQAHVEHLDATPGATAVREKLALDGSSGFALTPAGEVFADLFLVAVLCSEQDGDFVDAWAELPLGELLPSYRPADRRFAWGRHVLKFFRQRAGNQELLLAAAQELGWPGWFDDPLPPHGGTPAKVRLHDTIKDLNRRQRLPFVRFKGDGTGTRVGWELR
jgi:hypothetical protein